MAKAIIVLDGVNTGKNEFLKIVKNENHTFYPEDCWWVWSINTNDVLGVAARTLGCEGIRDSKYYEFISKLKDLSNAYWNFENNYIEEMVGKFNNSVKAQLLVVHGATEELAKQLEEDYGAMRIMITDVKSNKDFGSRYDKILVWDEDDFMNKVLETIKILIQ